jgi:leucyl aminopeptidase
MDEKGLAAWRESCDARARNWVVSTGFDAAPGTISLVPGTSGDLAAILAGVRIPMDLWSVADLSRGLPGGDYRLSPTITAEVAEGLAVGWGLGAYRYCRYRKPEREPARLVIPDGCDPAAVRRKVRGVSLVRDLVNTPAQDMMPENLGAAIEEMASGFAGEVRQIVGDELLAQGYPAIHTVGRASAHAPRLIDLRWGDETAPRLTLVGKGVCFDSGGLDMKSASGMRLMKKDMGGAAHVAGLAMMIMDARLPVRLRVLIPAVENAVSGNSYRPGDVIRARNGVAIEVDNTDAEGRVVLSDALAEACAESPELLMDFATLTGAARVGLGSEVPAFFTDSQVLADALAEAATVQADALWRLPLHRPYRRLIESKIADVANASSSTYGGAITAALFLNEFVDAATAWVHFDVMAWNERARPGRPEGGEAMGLLAAFHYLTARFA